MIKRTIWEKPCSRCGVVFVTRTKRKPVCEKCKKVYRCEYCKASNQNAHAEGCPKQSYTYVSKKGLNYD